MDNREDSRILSEVQHLLKTKGPGVLDPNGNTPMMWAVRKKNLNVVKGLVERFQLPINTQNFDGETPLSISVQCGLYDIVKYLIEHGANLNLANCRCETALHQAVVLGNLEIIELLIDEGSYLDAEDECGDTPLHFAVREDKSEVVEYLLSVGADADHMNHDEETPTELAQMVGSPSVKNIFSPQNVSPVFTATLENSLGVKTLLLQNSAKKQSNPTPQQSSSSLNLSSSTNEVWQGENSASYPKRLTPNSNLPNGYFTGQHLINV